MKMWLWSKWLRIFRSLLARLMHFFFLSLLFPLKSMTIFWDTSTWLLLYFTLWPPPLYHPPLSHLRVFFLWAITETQPLFTFIYHAIDKFTGLWSKSFLSILKSPFEVLNNTKDKTLIQASWKPSYEFIWKSVNLISSNKVNLVK